MDDKLKNEIEEARKMPLNEEDQRMINALDPGIRARLTNADAGYLTREMSTIKTELIKTIYPGLLARSVIPVNTAHSPDARGVQWGGYTEITSAMTGPVSNIGDVPRVDVSMKAKEYMPFLPIVNSFGFQYSEIAAASALGLPLNRMKSDVAKRSTEIVINTRAWSGEAAVGINGLFSAGNSVAYANVATGTGGYLWTQKTIEEILTDIDSMTTAYLAAGQYNFRPNKLLVPMSSRNQLNRKLTGLGMTGMSYILQNNEYFTDASQIVGIPELETAGAGTTKRMVMGQFTNDVLEMHIARDFSILEPQAGPYETMYYTLANTGGTTVYQPLGLLFRDAF